MVGVWIEPVTAQVMMTFRLAAMILLPSFRRPEPPFPGGYRGGRRWHPPSRVFGGKPGLAGGDAGGRHWHPLRVVFPPRSGGPSIQDEIKLRRSCRRPRAGGGPGVTGFPLSRE